MASRGNGGGGGRAGRGARGLAAAEAANRIIAAGGTGNPARDNRLAEEATRLFNNSIRLPNGRLPRTNRGVRVGGRGGRAGRTARGR